MSDDHLYENTPQPPVNTAMVAESEIDIDFKVVAEKKIRRLAQGNGASKDDINIEYFKDATLEFIATTKLNLKSKITERRESGQKIGPLKVSSPQHLREEIAREEHKITHNNDIVRRIQDFVIENRKDMGYGLNGELITIPFLAKDFVQYETCQTCRAKGNIPCQRCGAQDLRFVRNVMVTGLKFVASARATNLFKAPRAHSHVQNVSDAAKQHADFVTKRKKFNAAHAVPKAQRLVVFARVMPAIRSYPALKSRSCRNLTMIKQLLKIVSVQ